MRVKCSPLQDKHSLQMWTARLKTKGTVIETYVLGTVLDKVPMLAHYITHPS